MPAALVARVSGSILTVPVGVQFDPVLSAEKTEIGLLSDGEDHRVCVEDQGAVLVKRGVEAPLVVKDAFDPDELDRLDPIAAQDPSRSPPGMEGDALFQGFVEFILALDGFRSRHLIE